MSEAIEILRMKRNSLEAARKSTYDGAADSSFVRGLRAGLQLAVDALEQELAWLEKWETAKAELAAEKKEEN